MSRGSFYGAPTSFGRSYGRFSGYGYGRGGGQGAAIGANPFQLSGYGEGQGRVNGDFAGNNQEGLPKKTTFDFSGHRGRGGGSRFGSFGSGVRTPSSIVNSDTISPPKEGIIVNIGTPTPLQEHEEVYRPEKVTRANNVPQKYGGPVGNMITKPPVPMDVQSDNGHRFDEDFGGRVVTALEKTSHLLMKNGANRYGMPCTAPPSNSPMTSSFSSTRANGNGLDDAAVLFKEMAELSKSMCSVYGKLAKAFGDRLDEEEDDNGQ